MLRRNTDLVCLKDLTVKIIGDCEGVEVIESTNKTNLYDKDGAPHVGWIAPTASLLIVCVGLGLLSATVLVLIRKQRTNEERIEDLEMQEITRYVSSVSVSISY